MDPRKFVVNPQNLTCEEVKDFRVVKGNCKVARWYCHQDLIFVAAFYTYDWMLYATNLVPVTMSGVEMIGVVVTEFNHNDGDIRSSLQTANIPIRINKEAQAQISKIMTPRFTPVGHILRILPPENYFSFEPCEEIENDFLTGGENLNLDYFSEPHTN